MNNDHTIYAYSWLCLHFPMVATGINNNGVVHRSGKRHFEVLYQYFNVVG